MLSTSVIVSGYKPPRQERGKQAVAKIFDALIYLLSKHDNYYGSVTNQDIADEAGIKLSSLYQWFEKGKDTVIMVLAVELLAGDAEVYGPFFTNPKRTKEGIASFIRGLNQLTLDIYVERPGCYAVLHCPDVPKELIEFREVMRQQTIQVLAEVFKGFGFGPRRYLIATAINDIMYFMHQKFTRVVVVEPKRKKRRFEVQFDQEGQAEVEKALISYLRDAFESENLPYR